MSEQPSHALMHCWWKIPVLQHCTYVLMDVNGLIMLQQMLILCNVKWSRMVHKDLWLLFEYMEVLYCYSSARTGTLAGLSNFPGEIQVVGSHPMRSIVEAYSREFTQIALEWLAVQVFVAYMCSKAWWTRAGHGTEGALVGACMVTHVVSQQPLRCIIFGAVWALVPTHCNKTHHHSFLCKW
jgi:hypothetical protein